MEQNMLEAFIEKRFNASSKIIIDQANEIIEEYKSQRLILTVRQLYYQFVARDYIENNMRSYKRIVNIVNDARLAGKISWAAIEDRTRNLQTVGTWDSPASIVDSCVNCYTTDKWKEQPYYIEVWIEKEALTGVIAQICDELEIPYFACRGYVSQSEVYSAAKRFERITNYTDRQVIVLHLGDHDPSGMDMTRDNNDRLALLSNGADIKVVRIALNMDQVRLYNPPPNPAKLSDSRANDYIRDFGDSSWELDALSPTVIRDLIFNEVNKYKVHSQWEHDVVLQEEGRDELRKCVDLLREDDDE